MPNYPYCPPRPRSASMLLVDDHGRRKPVTLGSHSRHARGSDGPASISDLPRRRPEEFDVAVVGGGMAGLSTALHLSRIGFRTAVIESAPSVGAGSSTRNEGWLHAGTFHATSVASLNEAIAVASRCLYGSHWIQEYAPECVEGHDPAFAIVPDDLLEHALDRWEASSVPHMPATPAQRAMLKNEVVLDDDEHVFKVG